MAKLLFCTLNKLLNLAPTGLTVVMIVMRVMTIMVALVSVVMIMVVLVGVAVIIVTHSSGIGRELIFQIFFPAAGIMYSTSYMTQLHVTRSFFVIHIQQ